jgi:hypothetical protein
LHDLVVTFPESATFPHVWHLRNLSVISRYSVYFLAVCVNINRMWLLFGACARVDPFAGVLFPGHCDEKFVCIDWPLSSGFR